MFSTSLMQSMVRRKADESVLCTYSRQPLTCKGGQSNVMKQTWWRTAVYL